MNRYQLILLKRHSVTHELRYQVTCNDKIIVPDCTYQEGYSEVAKLISRGDSFQEVEGDQKSRLMSDQDVFLGNNVMNPSDFLDEKDNE